MIWAVAASCTIVRAQQADTTRLWTLPDCMRYAIENSPRAVRQQLANANLKISYNEAILKHLPSLSGSVGASAGFGRNVDPGTNTYTTVSTFSNSYSLGAGITVFNGLQLINNTRASKVAKLRGEEAQRQIEDAISMETMQAYYDYSYTIGTQRLAREQVEASRDNLRQGRRMMELGLRGAADVAQLEATLASDEYNLTKVENNMRSCELKLKEVMNYPPEAAIRASFAKNLKDTTIIMIAQRISSVRFADKILVLDEGRVAGFGSDKELMATCVVYRSIYASQHGEGRDA